MSLFAGSNRSKFESAAYTVLLLAFFFAVGLAGGVLYRVLPTDKAQEEAASAPAVAEAIEAPPPSVAPSPAATPPSAPVTPAPTQPPVAAAAPPQPQAPAPSAAPPAAAAIAESLSPPASKPAETAPRLAKRAAPPDRAAGEIAAAEKPPAPRAKPAAEAGKPKASFAAAQPPKPPAAKHASPPARATPASTPETGPFRIQFGAFAIEDNAHQIQWAVEATGLPVEIVQAPNRKGHLLYYVRSQPFPDRAAALGAATAAHDKAHQFAHPVAIDYVVLNDAMIAAEQGQTAKP